MIPSIKNLEIPLLKLLRQYECLTWNECTDILSNQFNLTEEERESVMPNGKCGIMKYRVGWAKANLKKLGLVDAKKRGVYYITTMGKNYVKDKNL